MSEPSLDILGIGNAIVDVLARAEDAFLETHNLVKGAMRLVGAEEAEALYAAMGPGTESSGGSAGNTCAVAAALGARVGFLGKVADDQLGRVFAHDIRAAGVHFPTAPLAGGAPTARCLILVTPDAQRTMNTYLGACVDFSAADVDEAEVTRARVLYMEGYLFDPPAAQAAFMEAARIAHRHGRKVALSLSDSFCVERHRQAFRRLVREEVDILFANESELLALYETTDFEAAARLAAGEVGLAALTRSAQGSLVVAGAERHEIAAVPTRVVDTTGAGDAYAAGFLAGYARDLPLPECGRWGSAAAAEIISHFGARPQGDLKTAILAGTGNHPVASVLG
ncbi:adenosine kinase [Roseicella sp. DB1501]|uniref:adenosine kinase n=1 Tax=Roseicella sp. DB1501 TaxID=2730925 RepID=UPI0014931A50|nr:adenosine kinase [Roseicella sp. DB1501]NOG72843.1 adenosine kinase [Roseicella sp. DB1501]